MTDRAERQEFPIVGIGASAGGLAAFERFFKNMPPNSGVAFVVVQHLSPPHKSILPEILQRYTSMTVYQVTDGIEVKSDCVYVIPPSRDLALMDGHLILLKQPTERGFRFPIDFFFRSLAEVRKDKAVGIILSGTASDGSLGIKTIKSEGGLTIAQDPDTADFSDMPRNAIATYDIDFILPPEKMGELILRYINHQTLVETQDVEDQSLKVPVTLQKLYHLLRSKTGHDFSLYKQNTLLRRIDRRIKITMVPNLEAYIDYLRDHPEEVDALFHEMLINVTTFFRDPDAFAALSDKVLGQLIPLKYATQAPLRVWVPGCSSGEEAYSIAILIQEQIDNLRMDCKLQIYATDLDAESIVEARKGVYVDGALENVSQERLKRFFIKEEDGYHIKKNIRDLVVFSTQNLIFDPPFSKIDLLSCRNVLIYLQPELQKQLFPMFHYALNPGGYLFLGNSESLGSHNDLFGITDRKNKIFQRKDVITQHRVRLQLQPTADYASIIPPQSEVRRPPEVGLREWTEKELLNYYSPACLIIDDKNNVLYIHGRTGKYLEPAPGEASSNLLRMAREGLKTELATAVHAAAASQKVVNRPRIRVKTNGDYELINLTIRPLDWKINELKLFMVVFEEVRDQPVEPLRKPEGDAVKDPQVVELEMALKEKDEYLTSIINELENANQELKSINEELLSSNEEMQSSNEELETSREELQSINEELSTVNIELQNKNAELTLLNNDVYNLLASTEIGTIFLDMDLHLRRFTPAIRDIYNFLPGDVGRPLSHFQSSLNYKHLFEDIQQVLSTLIPKAVEVQTRDGDWYLLNIQPYRTLDNLIDGAVVTFVDISKQKQSDEQRWLEAIIRDSNDAIIVQDFEGNIQAWNQAAVHMYGWSEEEAKSMRIQEMVPEHLREGFFDLYRRLQGGESVRPYETRRMTRSGRVIDVWVTPSVLYDYTGKPTGISTIERDITDRKRIDQRLRLENRALKALTEWYKFAQAQPGLSTLFQRICQVLVQTGGYRQAWIGRAAGGIDQPAEPLGWAGYEENDGKPPQVVGDLAGKSQSLIETALQTRRPIAIRTILTDPALESWRAESIGCGFNAFLVLPLFKGSEPWGVLVVYADEPEAFIEEEIENLKLLAGEISS